jgi:hypothetical protein
VKSRLNEDFLTLFRELPPSVREQARRRYRLFKADPNHPSLHFKPIKHPTEIIYSVRINKYCRALGYIEGDWIVWFWIGKHSTYDKLIGL